MATKKKLLQAAAGTAAASGGAGGLNVEDVFSTYLYEGNGIGKRIENGINLGDGTEEETIIHLTGDSITDSGPNSISLTNTAVVSSSSIKKFGTASLYFDANSSSRLTATDPSLNLGGGDYTVEMWLYINDASGTKGIFAFSNPSDDTIYDIGMYHSSNGLTWQTRYTPAASVSNLSSGSNTISNSTWHHVALVRYNDYHYMYIDGVSQGTPVDVTGLATGWNHLKLGTHWTDQYCFTGRIDEFRVTRKALYTANFTPPTAAFSTSYTSTTGEGGLVWVKNRTGADNHWLADTERGTSVVLATSNTYANIANNNRFASFNSNGFSLGNNGSVNGSTYDYASWTFRKAPKFFDVQTWSGNSAARTISHNLGTTVGTILVKKTSAAADWIVYHRSTGATQYLELNNTNAAGTYDMWNDTAPTSTEFSLSGYSKVNETGHTYVAYLFAHNDGDGEFGDGTQDIIKCGSFTGNGSSTGPEIDLGFEPQWVLLKDATNGSTNWNMHDNMRGISVGGADAILYANQNFAENASIARMDITPTGFKMRTSTIGWNASSANMIYIAIRRGPMAVPTDATDVFAMDFPASSGAWTVSSGFPIDHVIYGERSGTNKWFNFDRVRGEVYTKPNLTSAEAPYQANFDRMDGIVFPTTTGDFSDYINYMWRRAPSFFDVVAYVGNRTNGASQVISHNLTVTPEMIWVKNRTEAQPWQVYSAATGNTKAMYLDTTDGATTDNSWGNTSPTETNFTVGNDGATNNTGNNHIAYLFASLDGVSKVGSITGNGSTSGDSQTIDCGFTSGARFVLIKRTSGPSGWYVWDSERGIVAGNDPFLALNNTNAENTSVDLIDPTSSGFIFNYDNGWMTNISGETYIFYAVSA